MSANEMATDVMPQAPPSGVAGWDFRLMEAAFFQPPGRRRPLARVAGTHLRASAASCRNFYESPRNQTGGQLFVVGRMEGPLLPAELAKLGLLGIIRELGGQPWSLASLLEGINQPLCEINSQMREEPIRCSVFAALADPASASLTYFGAEPCRGFAWLEGDEFLPLETTGMKLGGATDVKIVERILPLSRMRRLVLLVGAPDLHQAGSDNTGTLHTLLEETVSLPAREQAEALISSFRNRATSEGIPVEESTALVADLRAESSCLIEDFLNSRVRAYEKEVGGLLNSSVFLG